jgi:hypothetical protein
MKATEVFQIRLTPHEKVMLQKLSNRKKRVSMSVVIRDLIKKAYLGD